MTLITPTPRTAAQLHRAALRIIQRAVSSASDADRFQFNANPFDPSPAASSSDNWPRVDASALRNRPRPPRRVKILAREFIHDSLYNPHYGYFPSKAVILDAPTAHKGFDFESVKSFAQWDDALARRYDELEEASSTGSAKDAVVGRQVWHTPTEIFKPYYAQAVARHLVSEYKLSLYPYSDLQIYEVGAGNGTLMAGILDYIKQHEPQVYERTIYHTIEISPRLASLQQQRATSTGHAERVKVVNKSIFDWNQDVDSSCFVLAFEVLDNLSHDVIRYRLEDGKPFQCTVEVDEKGEFTEVYETIRDPLVSRFLKLIKSIRPSSNFDFTQSSKLSSTYLQRLRAKLPFAPNLSERVFLPTRSLQLLDVLHRYFPSHRLLFSDFSSLPDAVKGKNGPVVQTRYKGQMVPVSTYLVSQGWFDIFFPTDFHLLKDLYAAVTARPPVLQQSKDGDELTPSTFFSPSAKIRKPLRVVSHREFLQNFGEPEKTRLKDGSNPMLESYENAAFIYSP